MKARSRLCDAGAAALLAACGPGVPAKRPNIVLIVVDTLRRDHLGVYGYERPTSPNLDCLAADAVRYDAAQSQAPWTLPSVAALLTGRDVAPLGIVDDENVLDEEFLLLSEVLGERGYVTGGIVSHKFVSAEWGFAQGFDSFDDSEARGHMAVSSPSLTDKAIAFIEGLIAPIEDASFFPSPGGAPPPLPVLMGAEVANEMIINQNIFVEGLIPAMTVRTLSPVEMRRYREPFLDKSRRKVLLDLMADVPFKGQPEDSYTATVRYAAWLKESDVPKLLFHATPGAAVREDNGALEKIRRLPNTTVVNLGPGIHFLQEDYPVEIGTGIARWLEQIEE